MSTVIDLENCRIQLACEQEQHLLEPTILSRIYGIIMYLHGISKCDSQAFQSSLIGASLSEPHTNRTVLQNVCLLACRYLP